MPEGLEQVLSAVQIQLVLHRLSAVCKSAATTDFRVLQLNVATGRYATSSFVATFETF